MTALLRLIREHDIKPDQVERVDVGTNRNMPNALIHHHPTDSLQAKFSMEFCMASLLLYRKAGLNEFTDEVVRRPEVQAMIERVRFGVHPEAEKAGYNKMTSIVEVRLRDGRALASRADIAKGNPGEPMSFAEVTEKFHECSRFAKWRVEKARGVVDAVTRLEDLPNLRLLTRNLAL
jgi:2-methylcitrate dehydratase PrpD